MSVTIQDDMWRSAKAMRGKQGDAFLLSLLRYGFDGEEPDEDSPIFPYFVLCKDRIGLSVRRSNTGAGRKSKAEQRKKSKPDFDSNQNEESAEINEPDNREEVSRGENEERRDDGVDSKSNAETNGQIAEIVSHLNATCGTSYRPNSKTCRKYIGARLAEGFTVADCKRVVDNMAARWLNDDRMRQYLRPNTLFRPEKFEGYLNSAGGGSADGFDDFAI